MGLFNVLKNNLSALHEVSRMDKGKTYIGVSIFLAIYKSLNPFIVTVFPGLIINELIGDRNLQRLVIYILLLVTLPFLNYIFNAICGKWILRQSQTIGNAFVKQFYYRNSTISYELLEQPRIKSLQSRAQDTMNNTLDVVSHTCSFLTAIITFASIFAVLATINIIIIIFLLVLMVINYFADNRLQAWRQSKRSESSQLTNAQAVYSFYLENFSFEKENRIYGFLDILINYYSNNQKKIDIISTEGFQVRRKNGLIHATTALLQTIGVYVYSFIGIFDNTLTIGEMSIMLSASIQFSTLISSVLQAYLILKENSEKREELNEYWTLTDSNLQTTDLTPVFDKDSIIEFDHVTFRYPGYENYVLRDFCLVIRGNECLAVVGENGSGKSTFVKLLLRLYKPESGEIRLNGISIEEYDIQKYTALFAPVFQDYAEYDLPFLDAVVSNQPFNEEKFNAVCNECNLTGLIEKLSHGLLTHIAREIDEEGYEPSGGEAQRIAIARALYRDSSVFLLDEPTAALDPNAEYEIYMQFANMINNKPAVLITHRLSAVQLTDRIAVFSNGRVEEYGTHAELYSRGGIYTEMFDKQAKFYRDSPTDNNDNLSQVE
jgi:ABC-type multidrug transport system fused ATPase/permease subunit